MSMDYPSLDTPTAGAFRFNTDRSQLEIYDGSQWTGVQSGLTPELQTGGTRGIYNEGTRIPGGTQDTIEYININNTGNATNFGDQTAGRTMCSVVADRTRLIFWGGENSGAKNTIDYVTIASVGNATD